MVEEMKKLVITMLIVLGCTVLSNANSTISAELVICREIELSLKYQFINDHKDLPVSWAEFEGIRMTKAGLLQYESFRAKTINSFAIVPGAPIIQSQLGIPREYSGWRLFLISRDENPTKTSGSGRYAILIKPEELDSKSVRTYSYFIPEETAQIILKQIKGFDPRKQPLAFENIDQLERDKKARQDQLTQEVKTHLKKTGKLGKVDQTIPDDHSKGSGRYWIAWVTAGSFIAAFLIWISCRNRSKR